MRNRCHIDEQAIGRIKRAPRAPALRPHGKLLKAREITRRIGRRGLEVRIKCARIGEHHAHPCAHAGTAVVYRINTRAMSGLGDEGGWRFALTFIRAPLFSLSPARLNPSRQLPAIDRKLRAPDCQNAPVFSGNVWEV